MNPLDAVYLHRPGLVTQNAGDEMLLLDDQAERIHQLNRTASFIWSLCDGRTPLSAIVQAVVRDYDVDEETASRDVADVIDKLQGQNLLCVSARYDA